MFGSAAYRLERGDGPDVVPHLHYNLMLQRLFQQSGEIRSKLRYKQKQVETKMNSSIKLDSTLEKKAKQLRTALAKVTWSYVRINMMSVLDDHKGNRQLALSN